jgi:predicted O-methyltransferase YrrM
MGARPSATTFASELWPDELAALLDVARISSSGGLFLEIGTAAGGTLSRLMKNFSDAERPRVVDTMLYFPNQSEIVKNNLRQHGLDPAQVDFRVSTSAAAFALAEAAQEAFDFMLIDGAHKICYVTQDLRWLRLLKPGGAACLHDYNDKHKGVKWPADRFLKKHPNYRLEKLVSNLLILRKTKAGPMEINFGDELWAAILSPFLQLELSLSKRLQKRP